MPPKKRKADAAGGAAKRGRAEAGGAQPAIPQTGDLSRAALQLWRHELTLGPRPAPRRRRRGAAAAADQQEESADPAGVLQRYDAVSSHPATGHYAGGESGDEDDEPERFRDYSAVCGTLLTVPLSRSRPGAASAAPAPAAQLDAERLGTLLQDALGLTGWKRDGGEKWSLRANASSGALYPLEVHLVAKASQLGGTSPPGTAVWHYHPLWHRAELRGALDAGWWDRAAQRLPPGAVVVALTCIVWRNEWKYGDPGVRYTHQDVGQALGSLAIAAAAHGCLATLLDGPTHSELAALVRAEGPEDPQCLVCIHSAAAKPREGGTWWRDFSLTPSPKSGGDWQVRAAPMPSARASAESAAAARAVRKNGPCPDSYWRDGTRAAAGADLRWCGGGQALRQLIHARRSAPGWPRGAKEPPLTVQEMDRILGRLAESPVWLPWRPSVAVVVFVARCSGLPPGVYLFDPHNVVSAVSGRSWPAASGCSHLRVLALDDRAGRLGHTACMEQGHGAYATYAFIGRRDRLTDIGPWMYARLHWEAGALSQALYIAVGAEGLAGTAFGAYYSQWTRCLLDALGVPARCFLDLLHWGFGPATAKDTRLLPGGGYSHLDKRKQDAC